MTREEMTPDGLRQAWLLVGLAFVLHLSFSLAINPPGYLSWDAGTYHLQVKTLAETGGFLVENGSDELMSPLLNVGQVRNPQGQLVGQYPEGYTLLTLPFYLAMGYPGLFFLNALAFVAVVLLIYPLALRLFGDRRLAFSAMAIYGFSTFAWDWSQSSYPHLSSTLLLLLAGYWIAGILFGQSERDWLAAVAAGLAAGFAIGVRLDSIFALPCLVVPLALARPVRWRALFAMGAGLAPPLLLQSLANQTKFGTYNPFSYGRSDQVGFEIFIRYLPAVAMGLVAVATVLLARRYFLQILDGERPAPRLPASWGPRGPWIAAGLLLAAAVTLAVLSEHVWKVIFGTYQIVVDLRVRPDIPEPALGRGPGGEVLYMFSGGVKKSLLQSCPWLALAYLPLLAAVRGHRDRWPIVFVAALPLPFLAVYGSTAWHGSIALNMRYLNPILPWLALLGAWTWRQLALRSGTGSSDGSGTGSSQGGPWKKPWFTPPLLAVVTFVPLVVLFLRYFTIPQKSVLFLTVPLTIAALLVATEIAGRLGVQIAEKLLPVLMLLALTFSAALVFGRDYPTSSAQRQYYNTALEQILPQIESPAIVLSDETDKIWGLLDTVDDVILTRPPMLVPPGAVGEMVRFHTLRGRNAYLLTSRSHTLERVALEGLEHELVARIVDPFVPPDEALLRLRPARPPAPAHQEAAQEAAQEPAQETEQPSVDR